MGVHSDWSGSGDFYIADNDFIGKADPNTLVGFAIRPPFDKVPAVRKELTQQLSQFAVKLYGSGHVVAYNRVRFFHDGIDFATYGLPDGYPNMIRERMPVSNDFYNNDISLVHDDCIEADGALYNMRVYRNLCVNTAGSGLSAQPVWGLAYFIRNIVYHDPGLFAALKLATPTAAVFYHNTFFASVYGGKTPKSSLNIGGPNLQFRGNLILAEDPADPAFVHGRVHERVQLGLQRLHVQARMAPNSATAGSLRHLPTRRADYSGAAGEALVRDARRSTRKPPARTRIASSSATTRSRIILPAQYEDPTRVFDVETLNFRLKAGGPAVDKGVALPNINDGYVGGAPDLGALEQGAPPRRTTDRA